jgi:hypothetical protein
VGRIAGILLVVVVGFLAWQYSQGSTTKVPDAPKVGLPKVDNPEDLAKKGADGLAGLPDWFWSFAVPLGIVVGLALWVRSKYPKFFWLVIGVGLCLFVVFAVVKP